MRTLPNHRGFSLIETLCVLGTIVFMMGIVAGATHHVQSAMRVRSSALEFVQTVKTARQYAMDQRCRTRIAFRPGIYETENRTPEPGDRSYRLYKFVVPGTTSANGGRWIEATAKLEDTQEGSAQAEWAWMSLTPRPEGMVGRWVPCDLDPNAKHLEESITLSSPLLNLFKDSDRETFFSENYFIPETSWTLKGAEPHDEENCTSIFPADYWKTPVHQFPTLLVGPVPEWAECFDPISGKIVEASQFWPDTVTFFAGMDGFKNEELPGIDFQADGSLACTWTKQLEFKFVPENRPDSGYLVVIDVMTGLARIVEEVVK